MRRVAWLTVGALALAAACEALARVGGGESYSGGSSHSSGSGGGGGGGDLVFLLFRILFAITIEHPVVGIPLDIVVFYVGYSIMKARSQSPDLAIGRTAPARGTPGAGVEIPQPARSRAQWLDAQRRLRALREKDDPNFSTVLFIDFAAFLYATAQHLRGEGGLEKISTFLSERTMTALYALSKDVRAVSGVVIGDIRIASVYENKGIDLTIFVALDANCTEELKAGGTRILRSAETWAFTRALGRLSRAPEAIRDLKCPSCGGPPERKFDGTCAFCGQRVDGGLLDWFVKSVEVTLEERPPIDTLSVAEVGTNLPTVVDPAFSRDRQTHKEIDWAGLEARARHIFLELQAAWSERRWERARPYETDAMFQQHSYWIEEYQRQKLRNVLDDVRVAAFTPVKIDEDRFFVAVTARIRASMIDYTAREDGKVVTGSPASRREFSEYWTLVRSRTFTPPKADSRRCPSCGAELRINRDGHCEFCAAKVTLGEFDWVLTRIEQDEAYAG